MKNKATKQDLLYMQQAIKLAHQSETEGNLPIGAIIVLDNKIIAKGKNGVLKPSFDFGNHAEINAINKIDGRLFATRGKDMTLYTNIEPCLMCFGSIVLHKIGKIVFGGYDKNKGACFLEDKIDKIYSKTQRPIIIGPICQEICGPMWEQANLIYQKTLAPTKQDIKIQIAGITNKNDAIMSAKLGVDIIGLLVGQKHTSNEFISKELAKEIKLSLPNNIKTTLITHLTDAKTIIDDAKYIDVDYIQLHSDIKESEVEKIVTALPNKKLIRVVHILQDGKILTDISKIEYVDFYITDSINLKTDQFGGTGLVHDYNIDKMLVKKLNKPVFVAGGLTPQNVAEVVKLCKPYGVDVNSGCRGKNGKRDKQKVKDFVYNAKNI